MNSFINKFYDKFGVVGAINHQHEIRVSRLVCKYPCARVVRACVRACVRYNYLFKINKNYRMHLADNRCSTIAKLELGDGRTVIAEGQRIKHVHSRSSLCQYGATSHLYVNYKRMPLYLWNLLLKTINYICVRFQIISYVVCCYIHVSLYFGL